MIRSRSLSELNAALSAAQGEFEAVDKSAANPFFKSSYAPLPEVVKAATPILTKHGLAVWQGSDTDDRGELLWTVVLHSSGQYIGSAARMLTVKNDPQAQGSAVSYQRRYQYMAALGLVADTDDDGESAMGRQRKPPSRTRKPAKGKSPTPASDGHSGADNGPQTPSDSDGLVSETTLEELARQYKASGASKGDLAAILSDVGADGKRTNEITEDQATWVILKLRERAK